MPKPVVSFLIRSNKYINIRVYWHGKYTIRSTGIECAAKDFDSDRVSIKKSSDNYEHASKSLTVIKSKVERTLLQYELNEIDFDPVDFISKIFTSTKQDLGLLEFARNEIEVRRSNVSDSTTRTMLYFLKSLERFGTRLTVKQVNRTFIEQYSSHLGSIGLKDSTKSEYLQRLRRLVNWAIEKGMIDKSPFDKYEIKHSKAIKRVLIMSEIQALISLYKSNILKVAHQRTLQHFLFSCFTGLRYSDIAKLDASEVKGDFIYIVQKKTSEALAIPINQHARVFLPSAISGKVFKVAPNQHVNVYLKEIARAAGIEPISFHCARHSFITFAIEAGIDLSVVSKLAGHMNIASTMGYFHLTSQARLAAADKMDIFFG